MWLSLGVQPFCSSSAGLHYFTPAPVLQATTALWPWCCAVLCLAARMPVPARRSAMGLAGAPSATSATASATSASAAKPQPEPQPQPQLQEAASRTVASRMANFLSHVPHLHLRRDSKKFVHAGTSGKDCRLLQCLIVLACC